MLVWGEVGGQQGDVLIPAGELEGADAVEDGGEAELASREGFLGRWVSELAFGAFGGSLSEPSLPRDVPSSTLSNKIANRPR